MLQLTPEQIAYKEQTLNQLITNHAMLEAQLAYETQPNTVKNIQRQLSEIEDHISRLQDELNGIMVLEESVADDLFKKITRALANQKFHLARRYISKLETIEPFYPGLSRLKQEAGAEQVSRRTRSIAQGTASGYSGLANTTLALPTTANPPQIQEGAMASPEFATRYYEDERTGAWYSPLFQFHIIVSCLVIVLLGCVMLAIGSVSFLEWFITGL